MRTLVSLVTGFLIAPIAAYGLRVAVEATGSAPVSRAMAAAVAAGLALLFSLVGRPAVRRRKGTGAALIGAGVAIAMLAPRSLLDLPWLAILATAAPFAAGLALLGGGSASLPSLSIGAALGLVATELWLVPAHGFWVSVPLAAALLVVARGASAPDDRVPIGSRWLDLALAGLVLGYAITLATPFALQHMSGGRSSHVAIAAVTLLGIGIASAVVGVFRPAGLLDAAMRVALPLVAVLAIHLKFRGLVGSNDARVLSPTNGRDDFGAMLLRFTGGLDDALWFELAVCQALFAVLSLACGAWIAHATRGRVDAPRVGVVVLGFALGAPLGIRSLKSEGMWPTPLVGTPQASVRRGAVELTEDHVIGPRGVLRLARNMTVAEGKPHLLWHGRRATRTPAFKLLEEEEVRLPGRVGCTGELLLVGNVTAPHRRAFGSTPFSGYRVAGTIPWFDNPELFEEERRSLGDPKLRGPFGAISILSTPNHSAESALALTRGRMTRLAEELDADGSLFVWLDLRASDRALICGVHRAVRSRFEQTRVWIALDGYVGPFVCIEGGPLRPPGDASPFLTAVDLGEWLDSSRTSSMTDPIAETRTPRSLRFLPLAPGSRLRSLADAFVGDDVTAALLRALAVHSDAYLPLETPNDPNERHRLLPDECEQLVIAIDAGPDSASALNQIKQFAAIAGAKKAYERLDQVLLPTLEHLPDDTGLRFLSGRTAFDLLDYESAIEDLEIAIRENRRNHEALVMLGLSYARLDPPDHASAISALQGARELRPDDIDILRALGMTLADAGRSGEAIQLLQRVIMERPTDVEVQTRLFEVQNEH